MKYASFPASANLPTGYKLKISTWKLNLQVNAKLLSCSLYCFTTAEVELCCRHLGIHNTRGLEHYMFSTPFAFSHPVSTGLENMRKLFSSSRASEAVHSLRPPSSLRSSVGERGLEHYMFSIPIGYFTSQARKISQSGFESSLHRAKYSRKPLRAFLLILWAREDSNLQPLRDVLLRHARIPIPPLAR